MSSGSLELEECLADADQFFAGALVGDLLCRFAAQRLRGRRWLHASPRDDAAFERGIGHCILPKRNRPILPAPDAFHLVTKALPECGENVRVSLGGFFIRDGWGDPALSSA